MPLTLPSALRVGNPRSRVMEIRIQVIVDNDERTRRDIAHWERASLASETLRLQLDEARALLQASQEAMVGAQVDAYLAQHAGCPHCGRAHRLKGRHEIVVRSLFGTLRLGSPRFRHCSCQGSSSRPNAHPPRWDTAGHPRERPIPGAEWACLSRSAPSMTDPVGLCGLFTTTSLTAVRTGDLSCRKPRAASSR
jgi:hypothetical protein